MYVYDSKPAPEEAFLRHYGVEGGWAGWFKSCENKE